MYVSHIIGTLILFVNVIFTNGQGQFRPMFGRPMPFGMQGRQFGMRQFNGQGSPGMQTAFNRQGIQGIPGMQPSQGVQGRQTGFNGGLNIPPPPGFQQITGQVRNQLPTQIQNALPRNPFADTASGVNSVLNGAGGGFSTRFGGATGPELARQLTPAPGVGGGFSGAGGGATNNGGNFPGFGGGIPGQMPNFNLGFQMPPTNPQFGQRVAPEAQTRQQGTGPRNQPQAVMPRQVSGINLGNIQPGRRFSNEPAGQMTFPAQNVQTQAQPTNQFSPQSTFSQPPQQPQNNMQFGQQNPFGIPQTFGTPQTIGTPQTFGTPQTLRTPQTIGTPQTLGSQQSFATPQGSSSQGQRFGATRPNLSSGQSSDQTFGGRPASLAFPEQPLTQAIGVGRPSSTVQVPQGAPQLLPGEIEIAPPISPDAAAAIQGGTGGGPPSAVSEIITISDINGNILYRGVDLSDAEIEKITQQLVNNMTDAQAAEAARKGQELAAQGRLDSAGLGQAQTQPTGSQQMVQQQPVQQPSQQSSGFTGQGFSSWGPQQQGLRFPGQETLAGESRTVVNLVDQPNTQ